MFLMHFATTFHIRIENQNSYPPKTEFTKRISDRFFGTDWKTLRFLNHRLT
jgi:hypothetical protein